MRAHVGAFIVSLLFISSHMYGQSSIFNRLQEQFKTAQTVQEVEFQADALWAGKCVTQRKPDRLIGGALGVRVEHDRLLGQSTFFGVLHQESDTFYLDQTHPEALLTLQDIKTKFTNTASAETHKEKATLYWATYRSVRLQDRVEAHLLKKLEKDFGESYYVLYKTSNRGVSPVYCYFTKRMIGPQDEKVHEKQQEKTVKPKEEQLMKPGSKRGELE